MPTNIEIKARLNDVPAAHALLVTISDTPPQTLHQRDTFFRCARGRLKLREMGPGHGELIFYDRPDAAAAKRSDYEIVAVGDPAGGWSYEYGTGGGITVRSTVEEEWAETRWKAARLRAALHRT